MILDATTKKLQVVLGGAITSAQLQVNVSWADTQNGATFVPGSNSAVTNSGTPVDIVAAPAASTQRQVKEVTVQNTDTAAATVTVQTVDGANTRKNIVVTIQVGETLFFAAGQWGVLATNGAIKGSAGVSSVALTMPSDFAVAGSPIVTAGTLTVTANNQSANTFKAGPVSGGAAAPTYRTVVAADLNSLALTAGSVLFGNASGGVGQDNGKIFWDDTNFRLGILTSAPGCAVDLNVTSQTPPAAAAAGLRITGDGVGGVFLMDRVAGAPGIISRRYNGTFAVPTALALNDNIFAFFMEGYDGGAAGTQVSFLGTASENWVNGTNRGAKFVVSGTPNGSITRQTTLSVLGDGRTQPTGAYCDLSYSYQIPSTGATITPADTVATLICEPAGALVALTVNTPANPQDGQRFQFTCTQAITTLTIQASAGQTLKAGVAGAYVANSTFGWQYRLANTTWYRIHG